MDISIPPIDMSIVKELAQSRVELKRRTKCSAICDADAAFQVMGSRTDLGTESDMCVFWSGEVVGSQPAQRMVGTESRHVG